MKEVRVKALVRGVIRDVYIRPLTEGAEMPYPARLNWRGKTISGRVSQNENAQVIFSPLGSYANLV